MKNKFLIPALILSATLVSFSGCKKEESLTEQTKDAAGSAADALKSATETVKEGAEKAVDKVKEGAEVVKEGAEKAVDKAKESLTPAPDGAQTIIDKAQALVGEGKFQDALSALGGLSGMTLSEAQQKVVAGLKEQIQKGLAGGLPLGK